MCRLNEFIATYADQFINVNGHSFGKFNGILNNSPEKIVCLLFCFVLINSNPLEIMRNALIAIIY